MSGGEQSRLQFALTRDMKPITVLEPVAVLGLRTSVESSFDGLLPATGSFHSNHEYSSNGLRLGYPNELSFQKISLVSDGR